MPTSWNDASLENVQIADNEVSVIYHKGEDGKVVLEVLQTNPEWTLEIAWPGFDGAEVEILEGNAQTVSADGENMVYQSSDIKLVLGISPQ